MNEDILTGFSPVPSQIYLDKQPSLLLYSKPKIMPIKSPNLQMIEKLQIKAQILDIPIHEIE